MKNAGKLLTENKQEAFYDEVLKALWGYISDKLNIPVSQLSKDNIEDELSPNMEWLFPRTDKRLHRNIKCGEVNVWCSF